MINIIKALNYQIKRDLITYIMLFGGLLVALMPIAEMGFDSLGKLNGGLYAQSYLGIMLFIPYIMACVIGSRIVGMDMGDRTINYEILSGHSRLEIFAARVLMAIIWVVGIMVIVSAVPIAIFTIVNGWGPNVVFSQALANYVVEIMAGVRMTCFVILLTTIVRHPVAGGFMGYGILNVSIVPVMVLQEFFDIKLPHVLAMSDVYYMSELSNMTTVVEDGEKIAKYSIDIEPRFMLVSVVVAVAVSAVYVVLAYLALKKRDMK